MSDAAADAPTVTYELAGEVALIGIDRAAKRNAINDATLAALVEAVRRAGDEANAGVLFGHGDNFSAGLDLSEALRTRGTGDPRRPRSRNWHAGFDLIARGPIPFVAALAGAVIGGGLELAAAAHIRVADETAYFALPEGQRGIFVGGGGSVRIERLLGYARMADLMLTGRVLTAVEGERLNLAQYIVPAGEALPKARALAERICQNAPLSNYAITNGLPRMRDLSHDDGLFFESLLAQTTSANREAAERLRAFDEKRADRLDIPAGPATSD
ncbi:enoyl-CoA hydratase [Roseomonas sp. KE2513]|uniref:crotonase/enoyl-CoA hydratase family protein n=1 Tax=Roseomonas sp. KE2513 TaxID=2479202 RepID=UPI0018DF4226|nr:crotonase/enoyl-CoA hydratase family protein [Roseomonas sp. KE2513]MBI0538189.1 enoyl-CoA hydratase [Roseomonas sp. KE2513]